MMVFFFYFMRVDEQHVYPKYEHLKEVLNMLQDILISLAVGVAVVGVVAGLVLFFIRHPEYMAAVALVVILLVGVANAESQPTYWLRHVHVEVEQNEILFTRISDGEMFSIDYEQGWVEGENVVIIHDNGTPDDPYDDVVVTWSEWAEMGCDAKLMFE